MASLRYRGEVTLARWPLFVALAACASRDGPRVEPAPRDAPADPPPDAASPPSATTPRDAGAEAACEPGDKATQRFGTDCLCCHTGEFSVAGSVDDASLVDYIRVVDEDRNWVTTRPNGLSNFFHHERLRGTLEITLFGKDGRSISMKSRAPHGSCNACHRPGGTAPRLRAP
jgi:hypothetical protein